MLVLTRKTGEKIQIGSDITITVLELHGNRIKIGIEAPSDVPIRRNELAPVAASSRGERQAALVGVG